MQRIGLKWAVVALAGLLGVLPTAAAERQQHVVLRVNCGAKEQYVDLAGNRWAPDQWFSSAVAWGAVGGMTVQREGLTIESTDAPEVYLTERFSMEAYRLQVSDGQYALRLHFAETYEGIAAAGERVFDVTVNGQPALADLDPFAEGGGLARPVVRRVEELEPVDGEFRIGFHPKVQNAEINGIELIAVGITEQEAEQMAEELARRPVEEDVGRAMLDELRWQPHWVTRLGCIEGSLAYLGREVSRPWLAGTSGYAFALTIEKQLCPSAPFVWDNGEAFDALARNAGYSVVRVTEGPEMDADQARRNAWEMVRQSLDAGTPCFSFDIGGGEYFIVHGYDKGGYYYRGSDNSTRGPIPWQALGSTGIVGVVHVASVHLEDPADERSAVRDALRYALDMQQGAEQDNYTPGLRAYDTWIAALRDPDVDPHGASFNAQYWAECRRLAVGFLEEAKERLGDPALSPLFDEALEHYRTVSEHLNAVADVLPMDNQWGPRLKDQQLVDGVIADLRAARAAESEGLGSLARIVIALGAEVPGT